MAENMGTRGARRQIAGDALTAREAQVLEMIASGMTNVEAASQLGVPTPSHSLMYAALKPYVMGTPA